MRSIEITYRNGRDVLQAYWGFLANGGLTLQQDLGLAVGDPVSLRVTIASTRASYQLRGHVVRRPELAGPAHHTVIEFSPGEPHDLLLSAAWSETDNTPTRRFKRHSVAGPITVRMAQREHRCQLINLSSGGACVHVPPTATERPEPGSAVTIVWSGGRAVGVVRWLHAADLGVEFTRELSQHEIDVLLTGAA